jgi:RNA polymerase sigma-32 factor
VKVATTKAQRKLFFNLRSAKKRLGWLNAAEVDAVARDLGVSPDTVTEMDQRLSAQDPSFDIHPDQDDEQDRPAPAAYLRDLRFDPAARVEQSEWDEHNSGRLQRALAVLDDRSRDIVEQRWLADEKATLQDLATRYRVSAERIRQLEQMAMKRLRALLEA